MVVVDSINNLIKDEEFINKFANIIIYLFATGFFLIMFPDILSGDFHRPVDGDVGSSPQEIKEGLHELWGLLSLIGPINFIKFFIQQHLHTSNNNRATFRRKVSKEKQTTLEKNQESEKRKIALKKLKKSGLSLNDMREDLYDDTSETWGNVQMNIDDLASMTNKELETVVAEVKARRKTSNSMKKEARKKRKKADEKWKKEEREQDRLREEEHDRREEERDSVNRRWGQVSSNFSRMFGGFSNGSTTGSTTLSEPSHDMLGKRPRTKEHLEKLYRKEVGNYNPDINMDREKEALEEMVDLNNQRDSWADFFKSRG